MVPRSVCLAMDLADEKVGRVGRSPARGARPRDGGVAASSCLPGWTLPGHAARIDTMAATRWNGLRRRAVLAGLSSVALGACASRQRPLRQVQPERQTASAARIDASFASLALQLQARPGVKNELRSHPALAALARHRQMSSGKPVDADELLDEILGHIDNPKGAQRVLAYWGGREAELGEKSNAAANYLPDGQRFAGTLFFVVGYDIGVAAPPDIAINVGHEHFTPAPAEVSYYATHEVHHVGFMSLRGPPPLKNLDRAASLRRLVAYMSQLEGLAVHAAFPVRARDGALGADDDYAVYLDEGEAERVIEAYAVHRAAIASSGAVEPSVIEDVLNAMSSGHRLAYRFGALVAKEIEEHQGREMLVRSIQDPQIFDTVARRLAGLG